MKNGFDYEFWLIDDEIFLCAPCLNFYAGK